MNDSEKKLEEGPVAPAVSRGGPVRVCFPFIGDDIGGSHLSALKLIEHLDPARFEAIIVLHQSDGIFAEFLAEKGIGFVQAPDVVVPETGQFSGRMGSAMAAMGYMVNTLPKLRRFLKRQRIDILHTNDGRVHSLWTAAATGTSVRHVWHHRGDPQARGVNVLAPLFADHIVTVSRFARPNRPVRDIDTRWTVIHSPFDHPDTDATDTNPRQRLLDELNCPPETRFIGYFGLFVDRKRPKSMVEIVYEYGRRYPDQPLHAVLFGRPAEGSGRLEEDEIRQRARQLGVADRVHLMGFREPIEPWMRAVDLNLIPAVNEPFGRTLIEAMLLGTPVIATRHGGNPEAIEDGINGYLVEPEEPAAFVEPIYHLLTSKAEYARISGTARDMALENYGISKHVSSVASLYDSLIEDRRRG